MVITVHNERATNMVFHIYEDNQTKEYTQEWSITFGYNSIIYYAYNKTEQDEVNYKFIDILSVMKFTVGVYDMKRPLIEPTLVWQDDF